MRTIKLKQLTAERKLSPREMKDVRGGSIDYLCSCTIVDIVGAAMEYTDSHNTSAAVSETICDQLCSATCLDNTSCCDYSFYFFAGGN